MERKAVFPGTFDPFTKGHESIVERSLGLVDHLYIAIGVNDLKNSYFSLEKRLDMIRSLYAGNKKITVTSYEGLTVDFAKTTEARFIIRGVRSVNDFEYEKTIADTNKKISGIDTIVFFTEPEFTHISSTIVRELLKFGHDVKDFIPDNMKIE
ncbi:MAG: pantetheine-phosphate adenylyltransferase [Dysgonomonas sp.]